MSGSVKLDGDEIVIRIPKGEAHALRVALKPIREGEPTMNATKALRERLCKALAHLQTRAGI